MFFKWPSKSKSTPAGAVGAAAKEQVATSPSKASSAKTQPNALEPLAPGDLRRVVDASSLGFATTRELAPLPKLLGQERALAAIEFALGIRAPSFNLAVLGAPGSGKRTALRTILSEHARSAAPPSDWVYVHNFEDERRPRPLKLPAGMAKRLAEKMSVAIEEVLVSLKAAFEGHDYQARRHALEEEFHAPEERALEALTRKAEQQNIAVLRTPRGFVVAPMHEGRVVKPDVFKQLPQSMRREVEARVEALEKELERAMAAVPVVEREQRRRLVELDAEVASTAVERALDELSAEFQHLPEVAAHLAAVESDLVLRIPSLLHAADRLHKTPGVGIANLGCLRRYLVNVVVAHEASATAPVIEEINPRVANLTGLIEPVPAGTQASDAFAIRGGALHRANGGFLILDLASLEQQPAACEALRRTLRSSQIWIEEVTNDRPGIEPGSIPLDVKLILVGDTEQFVRLCERHPELGDHFKVQAVFEDSLRRSEESTREYARLIAGLAAGRGLKPIDAGGAARLIDEASRQAGDREKLTLEVGRLAGIIEEADYWAGRDKRELINRGDVVRSIEEQTHRVGRPRERVQENIEQGLVLIETEGAKVGQVNALSLAEARSCSFGRPWRITARVHAGKGRVTDIEREVNLGGPLHSKGIMILWGFLAGTLAERVPLALRASIVFEQSYGSVEGDSASLAELAALISSLAGVPVRQDLAITGAVNQWGEVHAVGGVNEKIEAFFDLCHARGLTGKQGVIIPRASLEQLMLREDVVEQVKEKWFSIYAVRTVEEAIELLTGMEAGIRTADGRFPKDTVYGRAEARLEEFAALLGSAPDRRQPAARGLRP